MSCSRGCGVGSTLPAFVSSKQPSRLVTTHACAGRGAGGEGRGGPGGGGAETFGPIGQTGTGGELLPPPPTFTLAQDQGRAVFSCTSSKLMLHGFPLRQEMTPGLWTVPRTRRNVMLRVLMLLLASPSGPQFPPTPTLKGAP